MTKKSRKIAAVALISLVGVAMCGSLINFSSSNFLGIAEENSYDVVLGNTNGKVLDSNYSLKTKTVVFRTDAGNSLKVNYKKAKAAEGKLATLAAGGSFYLEDPLWGLKAIRVVSNAASGDAVLKYGKTSSCIDGEVDLADGNVDGINAAFFRIDATNEVTISSISVNYSCSQDDCGFVVLDSEGTEDPFCLQMTSIGSDEYAVERYSANSDTRKVVIPDYYFSSDEPYGKVTTIKVTGSTGCFEDMNDMEELYLPNTIKSLEKYAFFGDFLKIKTFTLGLNLESISNRGIPNGVETLYYNSKNLNASTALIGTGGTYTPHLKTIYVSADVEKLSNSIVDKIANNVNVVYEGTEAEWAALVASASKWNVENVTCSDTVLTTVTLSYDGGTLDGVADSQTRTFALGRTFADPGKPIPPTGMIFDDWYLDAGYSTKAVFPVTVTPDMTIYAQFLPTPAGWTIDSPLVLSKDAPSTFETCVEANNFYFSYTAEVDEILNFEITDIVNIGGDYKSSTGYELWKAYSADGTELKVNGTDNGIDNNVSKISITSGNKVGPIKVKFKAGETIKLSFCFYYNSSVVSRRRYASAKINTVVSQSTNNYENEYAAELPIDSVVDVNANNSYSKFVWYKYTPTTDADYVLSINKFGTTSTRWSSVEVVTIDNYKITSLGKISAAGNGAAMKSYSLEAGKTYYFGVAYSGSGLNQFKVSSTIPAGYTKGSAIELTVGGETVKATYEGFDRKWFKFVTTVEQKYLISCSSYPSSVDIKLYKEDGTTTISTASLDDNGHKVANLVAGTYYFTTYVSSSYKDYDVSVSVPAEGSARSLAISHDWVNDEYTVNGSASGVWYTFKATASTKYNVSAPANASATFYEGTNSSAALTLNAGGTGALSLTKDKDYYVSVKTTETTPVTFTRSEYVGVLTGKSFLGVVFNGCKGGGSYYKAEFNADGYKWEGGTSYNATNVVTLSSGVTKMTTTKHKAVYVSADGTQAWFSESWSTSYQYFLTTSQSTYTQAAISGQGAGTSSFGETSGAYIQSVKANDDTRVYAAYIDGEAYFNGVVTFTSGSSINSTGAYTINFNGHVFDVVTSGSTITSITKTASPSSEGSEEGGSSTPEELPPFDFAGLAGSYRDSGNDYELEVIASTETLKFYVYDEYDSDWSVMGSFTYAGVEGTSYKFTGSSGTIYVTVSGTSITVTGLSAYARTYSK